MKKILPLISLPLGLSSCGSVLTTRNGFFCGGISPVYLHENGAFTIGEECDHMESTYTVLFSSSMR